MVFSFYHVHLGIKKGAYWLLQFPNNYHAHLLCFIQCKTVPTSLAFSPDGKLFAMMATDRKVRIFRFLSGKKIRVFDEDLQVYTDMQQSGRHLPDMEFGRRMAGEKDLEKTKNLRYSNITFDESGYFLLYATLFGIKVINIHTNRCVRIIGKNENVRFLSLALYQGKPNKGKAAATLVSYILRLHFKLID